MNPGQGGGSSLAFITELRRRHIRKRAVALTSHNSQETIKVALAQPGM